ncbi:carboxypeptidase-like regulatory domain-containing protein [Streptomyces sp. NBC_01723]|nr:carboxypeptidase-like regulatory domain-containing protein [Streptomyces sp. NBC_01723]
MLDSADQKAGRQQSDARGKVVFPDLGPGIYRLKQTASGSPLHEVVTDQDFIVTPGATTRLTITDRSRRSRSSCRPRTTRPESSCPARP